MLAVMPRFENCVWCGSLIEGKGRIDRIYCSDSHRVLACQARNGKRWKGARKPGTTPPPGEFIPRNALHLVAVRMKAQLDAALARIAELEAQLEDQREAAAADRQRDADQQRESEAEKIAAAVAEAVALATAAQQQKIDELVSEMNQLEVERISEQDCDLREFFAEQERANALEAELKETRDAVVDAYEWADDRQDALYLARDEVVAEKNRVSAREVELVDVRAELTAAQKLADDRGSELTTVQASLTAENKRVTSLEAELKKTRDELKTLRENAEQRQKDADRSKELLSQENADLRTRLRKRRIAYRKLCEKNASVRRKLATARTQAPKQRSAMPGNQSRTGDLAKQLTAANRARVKAEKRLTSAYRALEKEREKLWLQRKMQRELLATKTSALKDKISTLQQRATNTERALARHKSASLQQNQSLYSEYLQETPRVVAPATKTHRKPKRKKPIAKAPPRRAKQRTKKPGFAQRAWQAAGQVAVVAAAGVAGVWVGSGGPQKLLAGRKKAETPADEVSSMRTRKRTQSAA